MLPSWTLKRLSTEFYMKPSDGLYENATFSIDEVPNNYVVLRVLE